MTRPTIAPLSANPANRLTNCSAIAPTFSRIYSYKIAFASLFY